ncbi:MAG: hypothetical protein KDK65_06825, partial [Chlamydiia bacterium]|nr:hypothetical protein [Chlamydiia bacterium]
VNYLSPESSNKDRTEGFYKDILSKLGQTAPPREDDPRLWSRGQLGGSCAVRSTKAFLRANMTDPEYRRLKTELRMNHLLKVYREIKGGHADSLSYHVVALELVEQLKHTLVKHGETVPQELLRAETDIHERKTRLHGVVKKTADGTFKGHFNLALVAYRSGDMVTAEKNLAQAYALRSRVRKQALREFSMTFIPNHMGDFQQPQTRQQVNFLFGVYRTIGRENIRGSEAPFIGKVEQAYRDKHVATYYPTSLWVEQGGEKEDVEPGEPLV